MAKSAPANQPSFGESLRTAFGERYFSNELIGPFTRVGLGGVAEHLVIAETVEELIKAAQLAEQFGRPKAVLGTGSGVLVSDIGFGGLVIINQTDRLMFDVARSQVVVDSGVANDRLLNAAAARGLGGLEFLALVPGTIGGAVATNATVDDRQCLTSVRELILYISEEGVG